MSPSVLPPPQSRPPSYDAVLSHAWAAEEFTATEVMEATG